MLLESLEKKREANASTEMRIGASVLFEDSTPGKGRIDFRREARPERGWLARPIAAALDAGFIPRSDSSRGRG